MVEAGAEASAALGVLRYEAASLRRPRSLLSLPKRSDRGHELDPLDPIMGGAIRLVSDTAMVYLKSRISAIFTLRDQRT